MNVRTADRDPAPVPVSGGAYRSRLAALLAAGVIAGLSGMARATTLFQDDFSTDSGAWTSYDAAISVSGGTCQVTSNSSDARYVANAGAASWQNYSLDVDADMPAAGYEGIDLLFHVHDAASGRDQGHYYQITLNPSGWNRVFEMSGGSSDLHDTNTAGYSLNAWHHVHLDVLGSAATAYIDGTPVISYNGFSDYTYGGIGLKAFGGDTGSVSILYDNVVVATPEPASLSLMAIGAVALLMRRVKTSRNPFQPSLPLHPPG